MDCSDIISALKEVKHDSSANKSIRERVDRIISFIENDPELGKDKAIVEIEELLAANDIGPYLRTQIWNVVSMIESA